MFNLGFSKIDKISEINESMMPKVTTFIENGIIKAVSENFVGKPPREYEVNFSSVEYPQRMQQDIFHTSIKKRLDKILESEEIPDDNLPRKIFIGSITVIGLFLVFKSLRIVKG